MADIIRAILKKESIIISENELRARLTPATDPNSVKVKTAIAEVMDASNPTFLASRVKFSVSDEATVNFDGFSVKSEGLSRFLLGCDECFVLVVTLGCEVDRLIAKRALLSAYSGFITDAVASAITEAAADAAEREILGGRGARFSPGYADLSLTVQKDIFALLAPEKYIGVTLLDTLLMSPMKTVSAFLRPERK